jgi:hypothetical protein
MNTEILILLPSNLTTRDSMPLNPKAPAPKLIIIVLGNLDSAAVTEWSQILIEVEAPTATLVATDMVVGSNCANGVYACRLPLAGGRPGTIRFMEFSVEFIVIAALRFQSQ